MSTALSSIRMKNFFQRRQDTRPSPNAPVSDAYKVWLPPDASRAATPIGSGTNAWNQISGQNSARPRGNTHRSSSRARADTSSVPTSSVPTSSTYKYATVPPNNAGFYYPNQHAQAQPPQYYPLDRPDSRLGYVPYPYPNPQPFTAASVPFQTTTSSRREDKVTDGRGSSTVAASRPSSSRKHGESSRKHGEEKDRGRTTSRPSSSSIREHKRDEEVEMKKTRHRTRESSDTQKKRDSQLGDSHTEKYRDKSSRKESRRDGKSGPSTRVEEGDSSDSSFQRPSAGHRRRQLREGLFMMNKPQQEAVPFPAVPKAGLPVQPTAASSSSGKHTPQIPRMPVYLPTTQSRRPDEAQPGLSESDTDFNPRRRFFSRSTATGNAKQAKSTQLRESPVSPVAEKKAKESKGLWPFSRSKSSQKIAQNTPIDLPSTANLTQKKPRADSTPTRATPTPPDNVPSGRPEYRRHASDSTIGDHRNGSQQTDRTVVSQDSRFSTVPEIQSTGSKSFPATQSTESSARPIPTAYQQQAVPSLRSRHELSSRSQPGAPSVDRPAPSSGHRQNPILPSGPQQGQAPGVTVGSDQSQRPEVSLRRDGPDKSNLPPIYAPPMVSRTSDYPRIPERSTTPKVSQLVAGFEARSSDTQMHITQPAVKSAAKREVTEKSSLPQMYVPPLQLNDGTTGGLTSSRRPSAEANSHAVSSQSVVGRHKREDKTHTHVPGESSSAQARPVTNQPDGLKIQLRDLLTDNSSTSRTHETDQARGTKSRPKRTAATPTHHPTAKPSDWNPSSQLYAFAQPPVQVFTAGTSSIPFQRNAEIPASSKQAPTDSSRRPYISQSDSADRSREGVNRLGDDVYDTDRAHKQSSRSKRDPIAVMKTSSQDSSRHTSSPSPIILTHPNNSGSSRSIDKAKNTSSRPSSASRSHAHTAYPEVQSSGTNEFLSVPLNIPPGDRTPQRDQRRASTIQPISNPAAPPSSSHDHSERSRPAPSMSMRSSPSNHPVLQATHPPSTSSRSAAPISSSSPAVDAPAAVVPQSSTSSSVTPGHFRTLPRASSRESILKTPSSLAPSILHPSVSRTSMPASVASETKKNGIFGVFRHKPGQEQVSPEIDVTRSAKAKDTRPRVTESGRESPARRRRPSTDSDESLSRYKNKAPPPISVPNPAVPIPDRKSPNSRGFSFRYLTTKRNRRISTASVDAEDGTAPNTVMGSPTASMQSSQMPQSPPQRDPRLATQDWRNQEESDVLARGKPRRMRPGVVFDVAENPEEETKRSRPARLKKSQPSPAEAPEASAGTDSSDA